MKATDHNNQVITAYNASQFKDAEISFKKAIELDPQYAEAHANLGNALNKSKLNVFNTKNIIMI